jgi:hypothetical protein
MTPRGREADVNLAQQEVYGVVGGAIGPDDPDGIHLYGVDTRSYGRGGVLAHLADVARAEEDARRDGLTPTPRLYATACLRSRARVLERRGRRRIRACFEALTGRPVAAVRADLDRRLASTRSAMDFDDLIDAYCAELLQGPPSYPRSVVVHLEGGWAVLGYYATRGPDAAVDEAAIRAALEGWLVVEARPGVDRPWAEHDVRAILSNPVYGYGLVLEPVGDLTEAVTAFLHGLADRPDDWTIESLDRAFRAFFARLEASGRFRRGPDAEPLIGKQQWLAAGLKRIRNIRSTGRDA